MTSKICAKCNKRKRIECFYKDATKNDGLCSYCKKCDSNKCKRLSKLNESKNKYNVFNENIKIKCSTCKKTLNYKMFDKNSNRKNGLCNVCRECRSKYIERIKSRNMKRLVPMSAKKVCNNCNSKKNINKFYKDITRNDGFSNICKQCELLYTQANRKSINFRRRSGYAKNPDKFLNSIRKRRAIKFGVRENYTSVDAKKTEMAFDNKCAKCGKTKKLVKDHHYPLILGYALSIENAVLLCNSCNSKKRDKMPAEFYNKTELKKINAILNRLKKDKDKINGY